MARTRAALALIAVAALAVMLVSGGSAADPRTPPGLPGLPPPFLTVAVVGDGETTAGIDAYGDVVDLRPGPAGRALIENPSDRQAAGTVPASTGIVPLFSLDDGPRMPLWRADSVGQRYLPGTNVLRTAARFGADRVAIECAASGPHLGCVGEPASETSFDRNLGGGESRVHLDDDVARQMIADAKAAGTGWLSRSRALGSAAPPWAREMYARSLLAMLALTDRRSGAVAAGARDGWAYVWPRDAGAVAIALAAAGHRAEARHITRFLLGLDLGAAARFDGEGEPVDGRAAQGDAAGWVAAAAAATGLGPANGGGPAGRSPRTTSDSRTIRADYQEKSAAPYLANALAGGPASATQRFLARRGLVRKAGDPRSGLDSAAAWAVRPFPHPALFGAARRTILALAWPRTGGGADPGSRGGGRFGIVPSEDWPERDPWTAPTAWSAWSLATLARLDGSSPVAPADRRAALGLLADLRRAATPSGLLPERVDARTGVPRSTAPLAWSHAFAVLALRALWPAPR